MLASPRSYSTMTLSFIFSPANSTHSTRCLHLPSSACNHAHSTRLTTFTSANLAASAVLSNNNNNNNNISSTSSSSRETNLRNMTPTPIDIVAAAPQANYRHNGDSSPSESSTTPDGNALQKPIHHDGNRNCNNNNANNFNSTSAVAQDISSSDTSIGNSSPSSLLSNPLVEAKASPQPYEHVLDCVLKVFCTHCEPNYELPWAMTPQRTSTSSAFIIPGRQILTNAHSVEHYTSVKVKRRDCDTKYPATVVAIGNECDIALLKVDDESFWEQFESGAAGHDPFLIPGPLPHLQNSVLVIGYPTPGNQISVTAGVSSRVEMQNYVHGQGELLTVQIDAAINPGNSGGPVINQHHQVVGIAFQSIDPSQADSVGYFIPYCIVQHFLDDIKQHDRYTGFPFVGFRWQRMENPYLRRAKKLPETESGILVKWVAETSDASRVIRKSDIVTHIDGVSVSNAGTVPFRSGERIGLEFLVTSKFSHDFLSVTIMRDGVQMVKSYQLSSMEEHRLVPVHDACHLVRRQPEYIVFGGLVFQTLSEPLMRALYGDNWLYESPVRIVDEYYRGTRTKAGRKEIVVLTQILATESNSGYESENGHDLVILRKVNDQAVQSLKHLATIIDQCPSDTHGMSFELEGDDIIILDRDAANAEEESVLFTHCIPAARSLCTDQSR